MKMTRILSIAVFSLAVLFAAFVATAGSESQGQGQWVRFKTGEVSLTLLDSNGVLPMKNAEVKLLSSEDNKELLSTVSDGSGRAMVTMGAGRYLLNVSGRTLAVVEFADDAALTSCRVVVPAQDMMVAGQEGPSSMLVPLIVGSTAVLVIPIYEHVDDESDDEVEESVGNTVPPPKPNNQPPRRSPVVSPR